MTEKKNLKSIILLVLATAALTAGCKKKPSGNPSPTPTGTPTATPSPSASPTPTPVPTPTPFAECIDELPDDPTPLPRTGPHCPSGFEPRVLGYNLPPGSPYRKEVCIAKSSCDRKDGKACELNEGKDITYKCHAMPDRWEYIHRDGCNDGHGPVPCDQGGLPYGLTYDIDRGRFDAYGRKYSQHVAASADSYFGPWKWAGYCPPRFCNDKPIGTLCNNPVPPPVSRFEWERVGQTHEGWLIDVTPIVCDGPPGSPTANYCSRVWNGEKTGCCPVRRDDDEMRETCENEIMGHDVNQNRGGPIFMETEAYIDKRDPRYDFRATVWFPGGRFKICTRRQPRVCTDAELR